MELTEAEKKAENKRKLVQIDLFAQLIIIIGSILFAFVDPFIGLGGFYLVLGGYQLISSLIHLGFRPMSGLRAAYYPQLIIHLLVLAVGLFTGSILILYIELFATAITAFYYLAVTIVELVKANRGVSNS